MRTSMEPGTSRAPVSPKAKSWGCSKEVKRGNRVGGAEGSCSPKEVGGWYRGQCPRLLKQKEAFRHPYVSREPALPGKPSPWQWSRGWKSSSALGAEMATFKEVLSPSGRQVPASPSEQQHCACWQRPRTQRWTRRCVPREGGQQHPRGCSGRCSLPPAPAVASHGTPGQRRWHPPS